MLRGARSIGGRVAPEPRATAFDLNELQRRLRDQAIDAPHDPQALELRDRGPRFALAGRSRRPSNRGCRPSAGPDADSAVTEPRYRGGAHSSPGARALGLELGRRVIGLQRRIAALERALAESETAAAIGLLEADLAFLRGVLGDAIAKDPNLIALEDRLGRPRQSLE